MKRPSTNSITGLKIHRIIEYSDKSFSKWELITPIVLSKQIRDSVFLAGRIIQD